MAVMSRLISTSSPAGWTKRASRSSPASAPAYTASAPPRSDTIPQGPNAPLNQVLLQAPGVAQDSFGQIHVRGEHANVQYRLNGVELPEGLSVFGQAIEARFANSISLITGALPAQYGFQTAGVVDIQTKSGTTNPGLTMSMYGGSFGWLQPSFEYGGRSGPYDWFITGDFLHNNIGIENPTASYNALHDTTNQLHGLAYLSAIVDPDTRLSLILGGFSGQFQIPNNPGQTPSFVVNGISNFNSASLNETQRETNDFAIISLQKHVNDVDLQVSPYVRYSWLRFSPDWLGDLMFNGIAQQATRSNTAYGVQTDGSWRINEQHTLRAGFQVEQEMTSGNTFSQVLPDRFLQARQSRIPRSASPRASAKTGGLYGMYIQDEWRVLPKLTVNLGLRFDGVAEFTNETQVSPRVNVVWKPTSTTTIHAGYARYFAPPPFELVSSASVIQFVGTTAAPEVTQNDAVKAERSNYYDIGISQVLARGLMVGIDGYYKTSNNLIDEGQFGAPVILAAFNYAHGVQQGVELTASYDQGPWSAYGNIAWSRAMGKDITSAQFNFGADELAFIGQNFIHLDHDQTWTGSAGVAYTLNRDSDHPTRFSADAFLQSGLRASTPTIPNGISLPTYGTVNLSVVQRLATNTELRLDVLNVGDTVYQIRNGTGVGVGAPQYGLRRAILAGVSQHF